jgi:hypothetical protein
VGGSENAAEVRYPSDDKLAVINTGCCHRLA